MKVKNFYKAFKFWNKGSWKSFFFSSLMLIVSTALVVLFLCLGQGIKSALGRIFSSSLSQGQILVTSKSEMVGFFTIEDEKAITLNRAAALAISRIDGVEHIDSQLFCNVPAALTGHIPGLEGSYFTDIAIEGVDSVIIDDISARKIFQKDFYDSSERILPVIISSSLINLYNAGFAPANNLPGLTPEAVIGLEGDLIIGMSSIITNREDSLIPKKFRIRLVGLSNNLSLLALGVPIEFAKQVNNYFHPDQIQEYSSLIVTVDSPSNVSRVVEKIEKLGFKTKTDNEIIKRTSSFLRLVSFGITVFSLIIVVSSLISTVYTISRQIINRSPQIAVLRSLGATPDVLTSLFSAQVFFISIIDMLVGTSIGIVLAMLLNKIIEITMPSVYILTQGVIKYPWIILIVLFLTLSIIPSIVAYFIFIKIISRNLPELLSE